MNRYPLADINTLPDEELWMAHELCRQSLVRRARRLLQSNVRYLSDRSKVKVDKTKNTLSPDILTIGFARRFADSVGLFKARPELEEASERGDAERRHCGRACQRTDQPDRRGVRRRPCRGSGCGRQTV